MKKEYMKPEAELVSLYSKEKITAEMPVELYAISDPETDVNISTDIGVGEGDASWPK